MRAPHSLGPGGGDRSLQGGVPCRPLCHALGGTRWLRPPVSGIAGNGGNCTRPVWKPRGPAAGPTEIGLRVLGAVFAAHCLSWNTATVILLFGNTPLQGNKSFCVVLSTCSEPHSYATCPWWIHSPGSCYVLAFAVPSDNRYPLSTPRSWLMSLLSAALRQCTMGKRRPQSLAEPVTVPWISGSLFPSCETAPAKAPRSAPAAGPSPSICLGSCFCRCPSSFNCL